MWVAEMDVPLAPPVRDVLIHAAATGDTGYAFGPAYAQALAVFADTRWGWHIDVEATAMVPDVMLGVVEMLELVTSRGDGVVVNTPVYGPFHGFIRNHGRRLVRAPLDTRHRLDLGALERAFADPATTAFLLCSPHNPTGTVHTAEELRAVAVLAERHGVRVVADEIHAPLVLSGTGFVPYLALPEAERGLALLSASKAWNLAGVKAAVAVAGDGARGDLDRMPEEVRHGVSHLGVLAHTAALRDGGDWLDALLDGLASNRDLLVALLREHLPGVAYRPGEATYLAWLDCSALGLGDDPAATFLERGRVALSPGPEFGAGGEGHARLNLATSADRLREGVTRMAAALPA